MIIEKIKEYRSILKQYRIWQKCVSEIKKNESYETIGKSLVIVPCDPENVGGSRGDEAMIIATIQQYRAIDPDIPIYIVVSDENGARYVESLDFNNITYIMSWNGSYPLIRIVNSIEKVQPKDVVILGADCMDGFYSNHISLSLLAIHDIFSCKKNVNSHLLGFSFNAKPSKFMVYAFKHISNDTKINLRDDVSLSRYKARVNSRASLTADQAFLLLPDYNFKEFEKFKIWSDNEHEKHHSVIGFNFHPMLKSYNSQNKITADAIKIAHSLETILENNKDLSFLLLPHDNRVRLTDNNMLMPIYDYLCEKGYSHRLFYDSYVYRADQIKAICSLVDGMISSRMHLAIAALGQGKSILVPTYQGKFQGLLNHFHLPQSCMLTPEEFLSEKLIARFDWYKENLTELNDCVVQELFSTKYKAKMNNI